MLAATLVVGLSGCGGGTGAGEVPAGLRGIEDVAEDAYDQALAGDFDAVSMDADTLDANWQQFRGQAAADGAATAALTAMDQAIAALKDTAAAATDAATVARAANAVSAPMDELFALYDPIVPPSILALDYLGREVVLDSMQANFSAAATTLDTIESTWKAIRPAVVDAGGDDAAADYDASIDLLRTDVTAEDGAKLRADANAELELVDALEQVFE